MSSISEVATCATTSTLRPQSRLRPGRSASADLSPFTRSARVLCSAGASPQRSAHSKDNARQANSTRVSMRNGMIVGSSVGILKLPRMRMPT